MKHLLLELVEATEAASIAAAKLVGNGDKVLIDKVATEAMRKRLNQINFCGQIAIGEGIKDGSVGLYKGEWVGTDCKTPYGKGLKPGHAMYTIAVDPVDGTSQTAKGGNEAMSVLAVGGRESLFDTETFYMNKIAISKEIHKELSVGIERPIKELIERIKDFLGRQITVCMLDRPRHDTIANDLRSCGCRIRFIQDCDVSGAIAAAMPATGIDLFLGIGGSPEGVLAAAAVKCLGGYFEGQLVDKNFKPIDDKIYTIDDLAKGDVMFAATGITEGSLLRGVRYKNGGVLTHSILMESSSKSLKRVESYYERNS